MQKNVKYRYFVGIDCGVNTGIAIWNSVLQKFERVESVKIHVAMKVVSDLFNSGGANTLFVRVEDARQRKWFGAHRPGPEVLQGVGSVKRDAGIWEDFLTDLGADFAMIHPIKGATKIKAEQFKKMCKWEKATNEHARDAACLVLGM